MLWSKKKNFPSRLATRAQRLSESELIGWTETTYSDVGRYLRESRTQDNLKEAASTCEALLHLLNERVRRTP